MYRWNVIFGAIPALLLASQVPVFLQMPLTPDAVLYDLQARCLMQGGVLYRDIVEPNLPGVVWIHSIVRTLAGTSGQTLRVFDLIVLCCVIGVMCRCFLTGANGRPLPPIAKAVLATLLLMFYLGRSEWCHCQRDTWMLLPCLIAVATRRWCLHENTVTNGSKSEATPATQRRRLMWYAMLEGVLWAVAFWIKPFVALPAVAVMLWSGQSFNSWSTWRLHSSVMIAAGAFVGLIGICWMVQAGCWDHFLEMMTSWNGDYYQAGRSRWSLERLQSHVARFWPWFLFHMPAITISIRDRKTLLHPLYLGWLIQSVLFQQLFDYVHVPGVILAISICVHSLESELSRDRLQGILESKWPQASVRHGGLISLGSGLIVVMSVLSAVREIYDQTQYSRACLAACSGDALPATVKDAISQSPFPCWEEFDSLIDQMRQLDIDGEKLMAYNGNLIHVYPELGLQPPTRFVYFDVLARCFPRRRDEMLRELDRAGVRYVIANLREDGWEDDVPADQILPEPLTSSQEDLFFPYNQRPIVRSGSYVLFEIAGPTGPLTTDYFPLSKFHTKITAINESRRLE